MFLNPVVNGRHLEINSVRNVFPRDTKDWVLWIQEGKLLGGNTKQIQTLIDKQRKTLADVDYIDLDSVTKILNSDGYSKFSDVKNFRNDSSRLGKDYAEALHGDDEGNNDIAFPRG